MTTTKKGRHFFWGGGVHHQRKSWLRVREKGPRLTLVYGAPEWLIRPWSRRSRRRLMTESKVALHTIYEKLSQEHINKAPLVLTSSSCSNSVHLQVCSLMLAPINRLFSEPPADYRWRQRLERWEMGVVLVEAA